MGRRGENIHKRSDGRWEARVVCGPPVDGRTNYKSLYSPTYQGARALKKEFLLNLSMKTESVPVSSAASASMDVAVFLFRDVANEWLANQKLSVKESTYAIYTFIVEKHLFSAFGDLAIKDMGSERIDAFLLDKKSHGSIRNGAPLSDKTVSEIKGTLNRILRYAKSHNIIDMVPDSMPVSVKQPPIEVLTRQEQESLEAEALMEDTFFSLGVLLCLNTGIREGELCGLRWSDFDWENGTVSICRTVYRIPNVDDPSGPKTRVVVEKPKTLCSIRTIPLPSDIIPYLKERAGAASEYVVTGREKHMEPRVCRERYARFEKRAGIKHHNFHTLRHTYSTNCIKDGVNTKVLSENLGHSNVNITLQLYVHPSMETKKAEMNKLTTFMNRSQK